MADLAHQHIAEPSRGRTRRDGGQASGRGCPDDGRVYDAPGRMLCDRAGPTPAAPLADNNHTTIRIG